MSRICLGQYADTDLEKELPQLIIWISVDQAHQIVDHGPVITTMNYRIDRPVIGENPLVFRVSGRLHRQALATLRELLGKERGALAMDLKEVTLVDREAVRFLAVSEAQGIELKNCPAYIREWIDRERH